MSKKFKDVDSFSKILGSVRLEVPTIDPEVLEDPTRFNDVVKAKMNGIKQIREGMSHALSWLDTVQKWIKDTVDPEERRVARETVADNIGEMEEYVKKCLSAEEVSFKRTAGVVYLKHIFSRDISEREEASELLKDMEARGFMEKDRFGPVSIGYQRYRLSSEYGFGEKEVSEIEQAVQKFSQKLKQFIYHERVEKTENFESQANITLQEFLDKKPGICLLKDIPPETYVKNDGEDGWRPGGDLLLSLNDKETIVPLGAVGAIEGVVNEAIRLNVSLKHFHLDWERPPGNGKTAFQRIFEAVMKAHNLSEKNAEDHVRKIQVVWHLIQRAIQAAENMKELELLKEEYTQEADISPEEFFGLPNEEPKQGTALLVFNGVFKNKNGDAPVVNLFGLFKQERREDNGKFVVRFVRGPEHVKQFLVAFQDKEYLTERNFRNAPERLGRVLRGIRGQVEMAVQIAAE